MPKLWYINHCTGPFNSGVLVGREMWNYAKAPKNIIQKVDALKMIASDYNVSLPAAALQVSLANSIISSVIPDQGLVMKLKKF